jgi:hypothetical protein
MTTTQKDLDSADDIALLSHRHQDMQEKTDAMTTTAGNHWIECQHDFIHVLKITLFYDNIIFDKVYNSRAGVERSGDPSLPGSNPTVGRVCQSFG